MLADARNLHNYAQFHWGQRCNIIHLQSENPESKSQWLLCHVQLLEEAVNICEGRLQARQTQVVAYLDKAEDWTIEASSNKSGTCAQKSLNVRHAHPIHQGS